MQKAFVSQRQDNSNMSIEYFKLGCGKSQENSRQHIADKHTFCNERVYVLGDVYYDYTYTCNTVVA